MTCLRRTRRTRKESFEPDDLQHSRSLSLSRIIKKIKRKKKKKKEKEKKRAVLAKAFLIKSLCIEGDCDLKPLWENTFVLSILLSFFHCMMFS
jgi:hypothetical protein